MNPSIASLTLTELMQPSSYGDRVNRNVRFATVELLPDYEAMRKIVAQPTIPSDPPHADERQPTKE